MSLFVQVVNEEVKQVWDTQPPAGEAGWSAAVEVHPAITAKDVTAADRKNNLISKAKSTYQQAANEQTQLEIDGDGMDMDVLVAAKTAKDASITAINACTTHDDLDAL